MPLTIQTLQVTYNARKEKRNKKVAILQSDLHTLSKI